MREPDLLKPEDLQRLVAVRMPFGKYQGHLIADLPGAYLWSLIALSTWPAPGAVCPQAKEERRSGRPSTTE